jgi:hypothetical protein
MKEVALNLECWTCRNKVPIIVSEPPQFAHEIAGWANDVGWVGAIDSHWNRSLIFCCEGCRDKARTKDGHRFKKYRPKDQHVPDNA